MTANLKKADTEQEFDQIQHGSVTTPRMKFHYRTHGDPNGMPMLLLHGSFGSSRWWEPFMSLLPVEIYAIAIDLRGSGQSDHTENGYSISEQAEDLFAFIQAMSLREIDLVAHSSGGSIAIEFALNYSGIISTLSLVDSVPIEGVFTPIDTLMVLEKMKSDEELLRRSLHLLMPTVDAAFLGLEKTEHVSPTHVYANQSFYETLVTDAASISPVLFTAMAESLSKWNRFTDAQKLTLPALIIWGDQDEIVSRDATIRTLIALPGANNLEVLRGVGHSPMLEAPLTLAEKIIDFITEDYATLGSIRDSV